MGDDGNERRARVGDDGNDQHREKNGTERETPSLVLGNREKCVVTLPC